MGDDEGRALRRAFGRVGLEVSHYAHWNKSEVDGERVTKLLQTCELLYEQRSEQIATDLFIALAPHDPGDEKEPRLTAAQMVLSYVAKLNGMPSPFAEELQGKQQKSIEVRESAVRAIEEMNRLYPYYKDDRRLNRVWRQFGSPMGREGVGVGAVSIKYEKRDSTEGGPLA